MQVFRKRGEGFSGALEASSRQLYAAASIAKGYSAGLDRLTLCQRRKRSGFDVSPHAFETRTLKRVDHTARRNAGFDGIPVVAPQFRRRGAGAGDAGHKRYNAAHIGLEQTSTPDALRFGDLKEAQAPTGFEDAMEFTADSGKITQVAQRLTHAEEVDAGIGKRDGFRPPLDKAPHPAIERKPSCRHSDRCPPPGRDHPPVSRLRAPSDRCRCRCRRPAYPVSALLAGVIPSERRMRSVHYL